MSNDQQRRWVLVVLALLVVTACQPSATPPPATPVPPTVAATTQSSPSPVPAPSSTPPAPTLPAPTSPAATQAAQTPTVAAPLATASTSGDSRFGAVFFRPQLNDPSLPCSDLQEMGVSSTFFGAWWGLLEPEPGQYDWTSVDEPVDAALACGLEPMIKVTVSGPGEDGSLPEDLAAYSDFVSELARHLKGRVKAYAIENEVNNPRMTWTGETYGLLRATAYEAIKAADPAAQVLDGGMTMEAYFLARADELVKAGQPQQAIDMLQRFGKYMRRTKKKTPTSEEDLARWFERPHVERSLGLSSELYANQGTFDVVQLHYLQDAWELIPEYIGWVQDWVAEDNAAGKPFEFWEIGFGWEGEEAGIEFSEEAHAAGVVKTLVSALGEGASRIIYEPYGEPAQGADQTSMASRKLGRGLMTPSGPRLAASAYGMMASQLAGYDSAERLSLGSGIWAYRFATPRGDVYVVWAAEEVTVALPLEADSVTVTDVTGATFLADPTLLPVGTGPQFVSVPEVQPH